MAGVLTALGEAKVAASIGGTAINFAAVRVGDGNGAPITPNRLMTDLVRRVGTAYPITASARDPENPTHWRVTTEIPSDEGPFVVREIGIFDAAGDMIAIASHPMAEFLGPGGDQLSIIADIVFPVSGSANISVSITPSTLVPIARNLRPFWLTVESATVTAPPGSPAIGATYIVPAGASGAWVGLAGAIVQWTGEQWSTVNVPVGHLVSVIDQPLNSAWRFLRKESGGWVSAQATDSAFGLALADPSVHRSVNGRVTAPPGSPVDGSVYAIAANPTGDFAGKGGQIAKRRGTSWVYETPLDGHIVREAGTSGAFWQKAGADYTAVTFPTATHNHDDRYNTKTEIAEFLSEKSNTGHTHPQSQVTNLVSDLAAITALIGTRVAKAGDTMTGMLSIQRDLTAIVSQPLGDWQNNAHITMCAASDNTKRLALGVDQTRNPMVAAIQSFQALIGARNLALQPHGGNLGIRTLEPMEALDLNGTFCLRGDITGPSTSHAFTIGADPSSAATAGGFIQLYGQTSVLPGRVIIGSGGVERIGLATGGALVLNGSPAPSQQHVLGVNSFGQAVFKNLGDLGLGAIALCAYENRYGNAARGGIENGSVAAAGRARNCAVTFSTTTPGISGGDVLMTVTFGQSAGGTSYVVDGLQGLSLSNVTANGFTVNFGLEPQIIQHSFTVYI